MGARRRTSRSVGFVPCPGAGEEQSTDRALSSPFVDHLHQIQALHRPLHCSLQGRLSRHFPKAAVTHREPELGKAQPFISSHTASVWVCAGEAVVVWPMGTMSTNHQWISKMCSLLSRSCWVLFLASFLLLQQQNFFLVSLLCFQLLLLWKKFMWSCSHRQKYSSLCPYSLRSSIFSHPSASQSLIWWFWQVLPPVLCSEQTALKKASDYLFATRRACFINPST